MAKASDYQAKRVLKEALAVDPAPRAAVTPATGRRGGEALRPYRERRDFEVSPEPKGRKARASDFRFVVQKHDARRLHYDLRLELDGVLKSWAVTRGPSLVPGEKRLAVHTEDHPLEYLDFEGAIPKGEYGGGTMIVWDQGRWMPEGDPRAAYAKGHLAFTLEGERLRGRWHLVRTKPRAGKEQWLLLKSDDAFARLPGAPDILEEHLASVLTGRTNDDLAASGEVRSDHRARMGLKARASARADPSRVAGARKGVLPPFVEPCLATLVPHAPGGPGWLYEIKFDGYRLQARIDGGAVQLLTRSGLDWTAKFRPIAEALKGLGLASALLDGELVVEDESGRSDFSTLQADLKAGRTDRMVLYAFDLLYLDGADLRGATLLDRKALLASALGSAPAGGAVRLSEHLEDEGATLVSHACRLGLEGVVAKRKDQPYRSGRGEGWLKLKCTSSTDFVIGGYTASTAARAAVGSLILGVYDGEQLVHVGRTGTGFTVETGRDLWTRLDAVSRPDPPFAGRLAPEAKRGARWVEPRLVAEVEFRGWTGDGLLRHTAFKGLREDRDPASIVRTPAEEASSPAQPSRPERRAVVTANLTHPDRVLWPDVGVTKQGLAEFYTEIADWILPEIVDRPLSLVRCPDGTASKCFFQKHAWAGLDEGVVRRVTVGDDEALAIRDLSGLLALVQASVLEIHPWGSRLRSPERSDRLIFDLDPGDGVGFDAVVVGALEVRERLATLGLESLVKTTGGNGLHVVAPLKARATWDEAKGFAAALAAAMAADSPDRYTATLAKKVRSGRIFVDYLRNGRGATAVAAYSTRARAGARVATPVGWDELATLRAGNAYRIGTLPARLDHLPADPWAAMDALARPLPDARRRRGGP